MRSLYVFILALVLTAQAAMASNPLQARTRTESPRSTMESFYAAMEDYRIGKETDDEAKMARIGDAVHCLDLSEIPASLSRREAGKEAAILLKETLDRITLPKWDALPQTSATGTLPPKCNVDDTNITIVLETSGDRNGEYLFSAETVSRAREFYQTVKDLPYKEPNTGGAGYTDPWPERVLPAWAKIKTLGLNRWQWIGIGIFILLAMAMRRIVMSLAQIALIFTHAAKTPQLGAIIEQLSGPAGLLTSVVAWLAAIRFLDVQGASLTFLNQIFQILLFSAITWIIYRIVEIAAGRLRVSKELTTDPQLITLGARITKSAVIILGVLLCLQNLGVEVVSLLATLGIGGLAVALAAKDSLANFFGSLMIMLDRPFRVGDWIVVGGSEGAVEDIGFRSTRIRTGYNSIITIPNSDIASLKIDNMNLRKVHRIQTTIRLTYDTPSEKIPLFVEGIQKIITDHPRVQKGTDCVAFEGFNTYSLDVSVCFFFDIPDFNVELAERQKIFLQIMSLAGSMGLKYATPPA